jgi:hypothetical protein
MRALCFLVIILCVEYPSISKAQNTDFSLDMNVPVIHSWYQDGYDSHGMFHKTGKDTTRVGEQSLSHLKTSTVSGDTICYNGLLRVIYDPGLKLFRMISWYFYNDGSSDWVQMKQWKMLDIPATEDSLKLYFTTDNLENFHWQNFSYTYYEIWSYVGNPNGHFWTFNDSLNFTPRHFTGWISKKSILISSSVTQKDKSDKLSFYPNPVQAQLHINFNSPLTEPTLLFIYDIMGRKVKTTGIPASLQSIEISVADLQAGFYFVRYANDTYRIIINR